MDLNKNISVRLKLDDVINTTEEENLIHFLQILGDSLNFKPLIIFWYDQVLSEDINKFIIKYDDFITKYNVIVTNNVNVSCWFDICNLNDIPKYAFDNYKFRSVYPDDNKDKIFNSIMDFHNFLKNATFLSPNSGTYIFENTSHKKSEVRKAPNKPSYEKYNYKKDKHQ